MKFVVVLSIFTPFTTFPHGEGRAFKNSPVGWFSEGARLQGWPSRQTGLFAKIAYKAIS